ncbi:MAG TPA: endonuclease/exonuclease/phosphatase family protein, partial [Acidobacteriota bacterium]|nr:endonuclease/exonuclease/phosphatase family protein [Acidobacteriota bacterium]
YLLWMLIVAALLLLGVGGLAAQGVGEPQAKPRPLRILNYNIHHGTGNLDCLPGETSPPDCDFDLARIAEVIRSQEPDLVALQEVDRFWARSAYTDQPELLTDILGMEGCYGANLTLTPDNQSDLPRQYGTLILSRYPILECTNTFLPSVRPSDPPVAREQRGLLEVLVNVRGVPVRFYTAHLEHTSTYQDVRAAQINAIVESVGYFTEPTILAGDFNAVPTAPEMVPLFGLFFDAWVLGGDGGPGYTIRADVDDEPTRRIDYVLVSEDVGVQQATVVQNPLTRIASDHYPVLVEVELPGAAVGIGRGHRR